MTLRISRPAARSAVFVSIVARVFLVHAVDAPTTHNGAWLCPLLSVLLALPWLVCADYIGRLGTGRRNIRKPLFLALLPVTLLDGSDVLACIARSASYLALDRVSVRILILPVCLAVFWSLCKNGDAIGYAAMLWTRLFPALLLLIILLQLRCYRPGWLTPLLGAGSRAIAGGSIRTAGLIIPCSAMLLVAEDAPEAPAHRAALPALLIIAAVISAFLLALHLMMVPTSTTASDWLIRLDGLLVNGRAPLYLQLPMISVWYASLLHLLIGECFAAAALLQRLLPALDGRLCALLIAVAVGLIANVQAVNLLADAVSQWLYIAIAPLTALVIAVSLNRRGGARACA